MRDGILETVEGRRALRFERELFYPIQRVWQAVSRPSELEQWFPTVAQWEPTAGERIASHGMYGRVLEAEAPARLAWEFNADFYSFTLTETPAGTRLAFSHVFDLTVPAAQTAAGWDTYLQKLEALLAGRSLSDKEAFAQWDSLHEYYAVEFGEDPTPGRQFWEKLRRSLDLDA